MTTSTVQRAARRFGYGQLWSPGFRRGLAGVLVFTGLIEAGIRLAPVNLDYLPPPSMVTVRAVGLVTTRGFVVDIATTIYVWILALLVSVAVAVPAGIVLGSLPAVRVATRSLIEFLRPIPPVALLPLAILLLAGETQVKLALSVYGAVWPILFNTVYALSDVDPVAVDTAKAFGYGRLGVLRRVALPAAAPFIATGVRVSSSIVLILTISSGLMVGGESGIGVFVIAASSGAHNTDVVMAAAAIAGVLGWMGNDTLERVETRLFDWHFARHQMRR